MQLLNCNAMHAPHKNTHTQRERERRSTNYDECNYLLRFDCGQLFRRCYCCTLHSCVHYVRRWCVCVLSASRFVCLCKQKCFPFQFVFMVSLNPVQLNAGSVTRNQQKNLKYQRAKLETTRGPKKNSASKQLKHGRVNNTWLIC